MRHLPELVDDQDQLTTAPAEPRTSLFGDVPRPIWLLFLGAWATLFGLFALFFTTNGPATLAVFTAVFFALMILGLPAALGGLTEPSDRKFDGIVQTHTGPLGVYTAAVQIALIPVATVIGLIAFILLAK